MKKITVHRPAGQNTQTALGETDPSPMKSGWFLVPRSFCLWKGQPLCSPGPLLSLCYARSWSGKEHGEILSSRWTVVLTSKVCNFFCGSQISCLYMKCELCLVLLWVSPVLDTVGVICCFASGRWMELLRSSWFTSSSSHLAALILPNICGSNLWVLCLLM